MHCAHLYDAWNGSIVTRVIWGASPKPKLPRKTKQKNCRELGQSTKQPEYSKTGKNTRVSEWNLCWLCLQIKWFNGVRPKNRTNWILFRFFQFLVENSNNLFLTEFSIKYQIEVNCRHSRYLGNERFIICKHFLEVSMKLS